MKKFILTAVLVAVAATSAFAQISVGAGYLNYGSKVNSNSETALNGFYAGADYNIQLAGGLGVAPGVFFCYGGAQDVSTALGVTGTGNKNEMYVSVPVNVNYSLDLGVCKAFVYGGPTLQFGVSSNLVGTVSSSLLGSSSNTFDMYDGTDYSRFNMLVGGGLGVEVGDYRISFGYDWGILDRYKDDSYSIKNKVLHIGVAYLF